ncbi:hypothetical protein Y032_0002g515 [Ancylostoma ceylanicum]|uniref:Secreted protein n=1 Tax=Ancylostoma ceylanicum TaxID=53326 RepID=A0A016VZB0_9BILA|nr:hypothetical protein Y032_0002g515 [Ancylostoma ceylanicum]
MRCVLLYAVLNAALEFGAQISCRAPWVLCSELHPFLSAQMTLKQLQSIAQGRYKSSLYYTCARRYRCSSSHRTPQEIWVTDSRSALKTAYGGTHRITNGHDYLAKPSKPLILPKVSVLTPHKFIHRASTRLPWVNSMMHTGSESK